MLVIMSNEAKTKTESYHQNLTLRSLSLNKYGAPDILEDDIILLFAQK